MKRFNVLQSLIVLFIFSLMVWGLVPSEAEGSVPQLINFQGILKDGSGNPVANGSYSVTFTIYEVPTGGTALWTETQSVSTSGGLFAVLLGSTTPVPDSAFKGADRYLGIAVSPDPELSPRQRLVSVGYSYRVNSVDSASGGTITSKVSIGPGHTNTGANAFVAGENNTVSGSWAAVGGGTGNMASGTQATVSGGGVNGASGIQATVGGGAFDTASNDNATVGGGFSNTASGNSATVGGGTSNTASGGGATVGGGSTNNAAGDYPTVGGGYSNDASGDYATIPGGGGNSASGRFSFAAGRGAQALHSGAFVWNDSSVTAFTSTGPNQFLIRAGGGVGINTAIPSKALEVVGSIKTSDTLFANNVSSNSPLRLQTAGTTRMYIDDASGNVGIGITNPLNKLEVDGAIIATGEMDVQRTSGPAILRLITGVGSDHVIDMENISSVNWQFGTAGADFRWFKGFAGEKMRLTSAGNLGIGTTSPTEKLHVVGNICATGTIGACSDARFKRSIKPIEGSLGKIEKLQGVTYRWNRDEYPQFAEGNQIGFVAQEVRKILPEVVSEGSDGMLSVDYGRFSVVLLEAIKEQQKEIKELKAAIAKLQVERR